MLRLSPLTQLRLWLWNMPRIDLRSASNRDHTDVIRELRAVVDAADRSLYMGHGPVRIGERGDTLRALIRLRRDRERRATALADIATEPPRHPHEVDADVDTLLGWLDAGGTIP